MVPIVRHWSSGRNRLFVGLFDHEPTAQEVAQEQIRAGYHPAGYGDPYRIQTKPLTVNRYFPNAHMVSWECSDCCD